MPRFLFFLSELLWKVKRSGLHAKCHGVGRETKPRSSPAAAKGSKVCHVVTKVQTPPLPSHPDYPLPANHHEQSSTGEEKQSPSIARGSGSTQQRPHAPHLTPVAAPSAMAFTPATACGNPSLLLAPRASSRSSGAARAQALLCTPSTSAFRRLRTPASAATAPRWRRAAASTAIVCGKVRACLRRQLGCSGNGVRASVDAVGVGVGGRIRGGC